MVNRPLMALVDEYGLALLKFLIIMVLGIFGEIVKYGLNWKIEILHGELLKQMKYKAFKGPNW